MELMKYGGNWILREEIDLNFVKKINSFFDENLDIFRKSDEEEKNILSTRGDDTEQYWTLDKRNGFSINDEEYKKIEKKYSQIVLNTLKSSNILDFNSKFIDIEATSAWTVIGKEGSYHTVHDHGQRRLPAISAVLYLKVPDSIPSPKSENVLTIGKDEIYLILHTDPSDYYYEPTPNIYHVKPKVGTLLIFPPHIPHGTYPQNKGIRQTFNIDFQYNYSNSGRLQEKSLSYY